MIRFNVEVYEAIVTEWNEEGKDWSGDTFTKGGFHLGVAESNKIDDVLKEINTMFDVKKEDIDFNEDGQLTFAVQENSEALEDNNGHYLVDYTVAIEKVDNVEIIL